MLKQLVVWKVSIFAHFNQPLTTNNIAVVTRAWHKKSSKTRDSTTAKCTLRQRLVHDGTQAYEGRENRRI